MLNFRAAPNESKSKEIAWVSGGRGNASFDNSFIPVAGPNGGIPVLDYIAIHGEFVLTDAVAALAGEDVSRLIRKATLSQIDGLQRLTDIKGDTLRIISYAHNGADATHEHQDLTVAAGQTVRVTMVIPLSKAFAFEADDYGLPAWAFDKLDVAMAQDADVTQGTAAITITSGSYWLVAGWHEERSVVLHSVDAWREQEFDTTTTGTLQVGGRLQDLYLFVRGASGGQSMANLTGASIDHVMPTELLVEPDLKQRYARARGAATSAFATQGDPLRNDPFVASATGTLRAVAVLLTSGNKVWEGVEQKTALVRTSQSAALPDTITAVYRATQRKTQRMREALMDTFDVDASYIKTAGKTQRGGRSWTPEQAAYMPEKFFKIDPRTGKPAAGMPRRRR